MITAWTRATPGGTQAVIRLDSASVRVVASTAGAHLHLVVIFPDHQAYPGPWINRHIHPSKHGHRKAAVCHAAPPLVLLHALRPQARVRNHHLVCSPQQGRRLLRPARRVYRRNPRPAVDVPLFGRQHRPLRMGGQADWRCKQIHPAPVLGLLACPPADSVHPHTCKPINTSGWVETARKTQARY